MTSSKVKRSPLWDVLAPLPIGTKVKYVKKMCKCSECSNQRIMGATGVITLWNASKDYQSTYDTLKGETLYQVVLDGFNLRRTFRGAELEVI